MTANKTIDDKQKFVDAMHNYFGLQDLNDLEYWGDVYDSVVQALVTEVRANERQAMLGAVGKDIELRGDIDDDLRKFVPDIDKLSIEAYGSSPSFTRLYTRSIVRSTQRQIRTAIKLMGGE